jgi:AbiV family abortive infection protein
MIYAQSLSTRRSFSMTTLSLGQLTAARQTILCNAEDLLDDALLLLNERRYARSYAVSVLALEEMAKLAMVIGVKYSLEADKPADWKRFHERLLNHKDKLKLIALIWILLSTNLTGNPDPKAEMCRLLQDPEHRSKLNEGKQDGFYVGLRAGGIKDPRTVISEAAARDLYLHSKTLIQFFLSGEEETPQTSSFEGIPDLYGKYICLADDLSESPETVTLPR